MITVNEVALLRLLEDPTGPVGLDLQVRARRVTELAQQKVRLIMTRAPQVAQDVGFRIEEGSQGLQAVIGIRDSGKMSRYLAEKETREHVWLVPALQEGFDWRG